MIRSIKIFGREFYVPGWLNFLILAPLHWCAFAILRVAWIACKLPSPPHPFYNVAAAILTAGFYLAKWRFENGELKMS